MRKAAPYGVLSVILDPLPVPPPEGGGDYRGNSLSLRTRAVGLWPERVEKQGEGWGEGHRKYFISQKLVSISIFLIGVYRAIISPLKPPCCRYIPTCSDYAREAVHRHGFLRGGWLACRRILRCHPFGGHGQDEVPPVNVGN